MRTWYEEGRTGGSGSLSESKAIKSKVIKSKSLVLDFMTFD